MQSDKLRCEDLTDWKKKKITLWRQLLKYERQFLYVCIIIKKCIYNVKRKAIKVKPQQLPCLSCEIFLWNLLWFLSKEEVYELCYPVRLYYKWRHVEHCGWTWNLTDFIYLFGLVSSDFTADERMEIESIKMYKKDLLDDIQVTSAHRLYANDNHNVILVYYHQKFICAFDYYYNKC